MIAHLCGVTHHAELWSSSSSLLVEFYSSNTSEHTFDGFEARYNFLPASEGADDEDDVSEDDEEDEEEEEDSIKKEGDEKSVGPFHHESLAPASSTWPAVATMTTPPTTTTKRRPRTFFCLPFVCVECLTHFSEFFQLRRCLL